VERTDETVSVGSQDARDIEEARRARDAAIGTPRAIAAQRFLENVVARVKRKGSR
jgi:hypothetical protein